VAIAGFGAAARAAGASIETDNAAQIRLRDRLIEQVLARVPGARLVGEGERLPNTAQFLVPHDDEETLILALDMQGFAVSAGSACAAGAHRRSHVLEAMGLLEPGLAAVRVSLGASTMPAEVDGFVEALTAQVSSNTAVVTDAAIQEIVR
jgi:cysteine desulfurase